MTIRNDYEVSSEGAVRHWEFNHAALENTSPTETQPFAVNGLLPGTQASGTVLVVDNTDDIIIGDCTHAMVYRHFVRNARTYGGAVETGWGVIGEGDPVYYDRSATMPADVFLSTSPLDNTGAANPLFGFVVLFFGADTSIPTTTATAATETLAVMQEGA